MKSNQSLLTCLLCFCLSMLTYACVAADITVDSDTIPAVSKAVKITAPKVTAPTIAIAKAPAVKADKNLFKKIANSLKFRKNSQEKERKRVIGIFESLGINDSIEASAENIKILIDELSLRENQHYDSLIAIISEIRARKTEPEKEIVYVPAKEDPPVLPEPSEGKAVTDKDIEDLTNKLLPLISEKANEDKTDKDKRGTLAAIRKVRTGNPLEIHTITDTSKGIVKRFTLKLKNRAIVYGIHNFNKNNNYGDYKFSYLNTLIYNSLFVNGKTGNIKDLNGWDSAVIVSDAQKAGCEVIFTARIQQPFSTATFLADTKAQKTFVDNAIFLLKLRNAKGINIQFDGVTGLHKNAFTMFIKFLSDVLKIQDKNYKILVTIPASDTYGGYDLKGLTPFTDRFMVNFSAVNTSLFGPMTPLKGKNSMESTLSRYLNEDVPPEKLVPSVSYVGTKWAITPGKTKNIFIQPLTYAEIRGRYNWPVYYDDESASAVMDSLNKNQAAVRTIFFDDAVSLEKKYDYILDNALGGVSINALGYDRGYGELWDALSYKFSAIDTTYLKDSTINRMQNGHLTYLEKAARYLTLFGYILNNPCEICFENIPDSAYAIKVSRDLQELRIDSLILEANKTLPMEEKYRSKFEYVNSRLTSTLGFVTLLILILTLACGGFYLYMIKSESEEWAWKKNAEIILIGFCILLVLSSFVYLFTNDSIPIFGAAPKATNGKTISFSKDLSIAMAAEDASIGLNDSSATASINTSFCQVDPTDSCVNMPFTTLMIIISVGMVIGILITRYLIMPLLRRNDIP